MESDPIVRRRIADRYTVEGEVGRGAMGVVYRAHDEKHDRDVVLKVLDPEIARGVGGERFLREIQTAARQARLVDLPDLTIEEVRAVLAELTSRRDEQNKTAEPPSRRSYRRGSKNIDRGEQSYAVDEATG